MKPTTRKLTVESLEARRVLAAVGEPVLLDAADAGDPMLDGMPADIDMPPAGDGLGDYAPGHEGDWIRPIPQEAHHFVARLRPVGSDAAPADPALAEGEMNGAHPFPMPHAGGVARFFLNREETLLRFRLRVPFVQGVTSADIHLGQRADGGPSVATLFAFDQGTINGLFLRGELDESGIEPNSELGFDGTLASLVAAMRDGNAYVEVHTQDQPDGALRGVLHPLSWRPWHNPVNRMDVNGDQDVTPLDLLTVVHNMNENGVRMVDVPLEESAPLVAPFVDVTGDNILSPQDALVLVQFLTERGEDVLNQIGVPPAAISETLAELQQALQFDEPQTLTDIGNRFQEILSNQGVDVDALIDQVSQTWENDYRGRFAEWIGQAEDMAQQFADQFGGMDRDWGALYDEAFQDLGDIFPGGDTPFDGPLALPPLLAFNGGTPTFGGFRR